MSVSSITRPNSKQAAEILKCGKDPRYFINKYVYIQHPIKGTIKFDTYPFQDKCIDAFLEHRFNIVLKSRQMGLSTLAAAYATWLAIFRKDKNILIIATKLKTAQNFINKVKVILKRMPPWLMLPQITGNNKQELQFSNGSRIQAIPTSEDAGRSEALSLAIIDEAAFIRNFDTIWTALYSTLSTGGCGIILSTPNGVGDKYHEIYTKAELGQNEFNPIKIAWDEHPERDDAWFEKETANMSRKQIAQELLCDFVSSGNTFITNETLDHFRMMVQEPIEKSGPGSGLWIWKYPQTGIDYIISADVSRGDAFDYSAFHVIDTKHSEVVAEYKGKLRPDQFAEILYDTGKRYGNALICPESNTYGYAVILKLHDKGYKNLFYQTQQDKFDAMYGTDPKLHKIGFSTQGNNRNQILTKLEEVLRKNKIIIRSHRCLDELKTFVYMGSKAQAMKGKNDDLIMALAIGTWLYEQNEQKKENEHCSMVIAMLAAFGVNKVKIEEEDLRAFEIPSKAIVADNTLISSLNGYNILTNDNLSKNFGWLIK
jgi:hypothetical protein